VFEGQRSLAVGADQAQPAFRRDQHRGQIGTGHRPADVATDGGNGTHLCAADRKCGRGQRWQDRLHLWRSRDLRQSEGLSQHDYATFLPHAGGSGLAVRRAVHERIGGFDERLRRLEDTDYSWRLQLAGHAIHFEPAAVLEIRFRPQGPSSLYQAFLYGRYDGWLYRRYRRRGMARVPVFDDLKYLVNQVVHLPTTPRGTARAKRLRSIANRSGVLAGRVEGRWRR